MPPESGHVARSEGRTLDVYFEADTAEAGGRVDLKLRLTFDREIEHAVDCELAASLSLDGKQQRTARTRPKFIRSQNVTKEFRAVVRDVFGADVVQKKGTKAIPIGEYLIDLSLTFEDGTKMAIEGKRYSVRSGIAK